MDHHVESKQQDCLGKISLTDDLWSDPNLIPFMAVTSHWIQGTVVDTPDGPKLTLKLRADLIGFQRVPGRHDGRHLALALLRVTDCLKITEKVCNVVFEHTMLHLILSRLAGSLVIMRVIMIQ